MFLISSWHCKYIRMVFKTLILPLLYMLLLPWFLVCFQHHSLSTSSFLCRLLLLWQTSSWVLTFSFHSSLGKWMWSAQLIMCMYHSLALEYQAAVFNTRSVYPTIYLISLPFLIDMSKLLIIQFQGLFHQPFPLKSQIFSFAFGYFELINISLVDTFITLLLAHTSDVFFSIWALQTYQ